MTGLETDLKRAVVAHLRDLGFRVYVTSERRRGYSKMPTGWPDVFVRHVERRMCAWLEVKRYGERLTLEQEDFRAEALAAGETYWLVDSMVSLRAQLGRAGVMERRKSSLQGETPQP